jgi:hypothetical protein
VFLDPMGADSGWSRTGISAAMTLAFLSMGFAGFGWGISATASGLAREVPSGYSSFPVQSVGLSRQDHRGDLRLRGLKVGN